MRKIVLWAIIVFSALICVRAVLYSQWDTMRGTVRLEVPGSLRLHNYWKNDNQFIDVKINEAVIEGRIVEDARFTIDASKIGPNGVEKGFLLHDFTFVWLIYKPDTMDLAGLITPTHDQSKVRLPYGYRAAWLISAIPTTEDGYMVSVFQKDNRIDYLYTPTAAKGGPL